jgi:hypothetical protein
MLHHDNAQSHTSVLTQQFLAKYEITVFPHPPYSPCDLFLFLKMKLKLNGRRFDTIEEIQAEWQRVLDTDRKGLQEAFQNREDGGTGFYMRERTNSRVMATDRSYGEFYGFYSISLEYFRYNLVEFLWLFL